MLEKLEAVSERFREIDSLIADPDIMADRKRYTELLQEHARLQETVIEFDRYKERIIEIADAEQMVADETEPEMRDLAKEELRGLLESHAESTQQLKNLLVPKDPLDTKNIIMEIRAGTGGDEAASFAADLFRMYSRYGENRQWKIKVISASDIGIGGYKEVIFSVTGKNVFESLRYESGTHRVQRVPETESSGRIHTSAVTVAVLPEAEETDVELQPEDLRVDVYRSSGPGGQSVNTTDSAVRITHIPTGIVVTCQDEKSQHKNKAKALRVLRARLFEAAEAKKNRERAAARKNQIGSGDRSERIRTYNYPQNRVTDHRVNLTLYHLDTIVQGDIDAILESLKISARAEQMQSFE